MGFSGIDNGAGGNDAVPCSVFKTLQEQVAECLTVWGRPELIQQVDIRFSKRLRSALGRTRVHARHVKLNPILTHAKKQLLKEALCHELAHIVAYERYGNTIKPHGPEWAALVREVGYEPRLRVRVGRDRRTIAVPRFEHLCPVCQTVRYAKRPMTRWRCASCIDAGLEGRLLIRSIRKE
jgi:predicted SprT family Zn-dependent metalloprotease